MKQVFVNNAVSALSSALTDADTSIILTAGTGSLFPVLQNDDFFIGTLISTGATQIEVVKVTAVDTATDTLTVIRNFELCSSFSGPYAFDIGAIFELRLTAIAINTQIKNSIIHSMERGFDQALGSAYSEFQYDVDGNLITITIWDTSAKATELYAKTFTYTGDTLTSSTVQDLLNAYLISTQYTYSGDILISINKELS